jgi:hypothetical protein
VGHPLNSAPIVLGIFVSSTTNNGNLKTAGTIKGLPEPTDGFAGANNICQNRADAQSLGGSWKAWLGNNSVFTKNAIYQLPNNKELFTNTGSLTVENILAANKDETGALQDNKDVWTGVLIDGKPDKNCTDWEDGTNASAGSSGKTGGNETRNLYCDAPNHIICVEY